MTIRKVIANNVRILRRAQNLTLEQLGKTSRLNPQYIGRLEKSATINVTADNLEKLAKGLGVTVAELVSQGTATDKESAADLEHAIALLQKFHAPVTVGKDK